jgi:osmotically-inducible protein OsmY
MGRSASGVVASGLLLLLATTAALSMAQVPDPSEQTLPATDINRESNNPAKEAIKAREAQDKDKAKQEAVVEDSPPEPLGPVSDNAQLARRIEAALLNDVRTAKLGITVSLDEQNLIGLHGSVPSVQTRTAALELATKVAGTARVKNHLVISAKK